MSAEALRVALLARPGVARERLRGVMDEAGVERVIEADPTELELSALVAAAPRAVLVALDPVTEDVLDRFDEVLFDPAVDVIYEEADLAVAREGWDVARWQRHLVAKLQRHGDVLPPGREPDDERTPAEVAPPEAVAPTPGLSSGAPLDSIEALSFESEADAADAPPTGPLAGSIAASLDTTIRIPTGAPVDLPDLPQPSEPPTTTMDVEFAPMAGEADPFDPVLAEAGEGEVGSTVFDDGFLAGLEMATDGTAAGGTEIGGFAADGFDPHDGVAESDVALPPTGGPVTALQTPEPAPADANEVAPAASASAPIGFGNLSLDDGEGAVAMQGGSDHHRFRRDLDDLEQRISHLSLVDDTPVRGPEQPRGAVVVLAGIGGPDAVRQLLGALPVEFPRPVLIQQRLDGARHDKLVAQMQRATTIPVKLAQPGHAAEACTIYILPGEVGIAPGGSGLSFDESGDVLTHLPSADSAILLLSGSDAAQVDAVMNHSWAGALVAGQAAEGCYDAAAANALATRGGDTATPARIAALLTERWA